MLKDLKKTIIYSFIFSFSYIFILILYFFGFSLLFYGLSTQNPELYAIITVLFVLLSTVIIFGAGIYFVIKTILLTYKLKLELEFILMLIGIMVPFTYLIGCILVLVKTEEDIRKKEEEKTEEKELY